MRVPVENTNGLVSVPDIPELDLAVVSAGHNLVWLVGIKVKVPNRQRVGELDSPRLSQTPEIPATKGAVVCRANLVCSVRVPCHRAELGGALLVTSSDGD